MQSVLHGGKYEHDALLILFTHLTNGNYLKDKEGVYQGHPRWNNIYSIQIF
jgi:hypothetical protein